MDKNVKMGMKTTFWKELADYCQIRIRERKEYKSHL